MLFSSTSDEAKKALALREVQTNEAARRAKFAVRQQLLSGQYRDLVADRVREIFADPVQANRVAIVGDSSINVFKYVTDEIARFTGATRAFTKGGARDPVYADLEEKVEPFDLIMQEVVATLHACNDGLIQILPGLPGVDGKVGRPRIRVFRPHECTVIWRDDDPSQPRVVMYEHKGQDGKVVTVVWSDDEHYVIEDGSKVRAARGAWDTKNPFSRLPFIAIHAGLRSDSFWDEASGEDSVEFSLDHLAGWSAVRFLMHQQSYVQLAVVGVDEDWRPPSKTGPGTIWRIGGGPSADVKAIDLRTDPKSLVDALERNLAGHLASKGLNPDRLGQNPGQAPPSGLAMYLDRQRVLERRQAMLPFIVEAEYALAELYRAMWNLSHAPSEQIDPTAEFTVEVHEETVVESPQEAALTRKTRLEVIKLERELGMKSIVEQLAEERGISEAEARALLPTLQAKPEIFAYDQANAIVRIDEIRASMGLPPDEEIGHLTVPQLRALHPEWFAVPPASE